MLGLCHNLLTVFLVQEIIIALTLSFKKSNHYAFPSPYHFHAAACSTGFCQSWRNGRTICTERHER